MLQHFKKCWFKVVFSCFKNVRDNDIYCLKSALSVRCVTLFSSNVVFIECSTYQWHFGSVKFCSNLPIKVFLSIWSRFFQIKLHKRFFLNTLRCFFFLKCRHYLILLEYWSVCIYQYGKISSFLDTVYFLVFRSPE